MQECLKKSNMLYFDIFIDESNFSNRFNRFVVPHPQINSWEAVFF